MPKRKKASKKKTTKKASAKAVSTKSANSVKAFYDTKTFYCQLPVSDYKKSIEFYSDVLELEPSDFSKNGPDPQTIGWYEFQLPLKGAMLGLGYSEEINPSRSTVISVSDLDGIYSTLSTKKASPTDITDIPNMISFFTVNDPDENSIMFVAEPRVRQ